MTKISSIEKGRQEDGNRSIADKIIKRLHDLEKTAEYNQGRWAWELLQNAKDSISEFDNRTVSVQIVLNDESVEFKHNGYHFTELDIRGLINQISSKEAEQGQKSNKTGRFGTGFLTTHLLSRMIRIKGVVETENDGLYSFEFPLDRQAKNTNDLAQKVELSWNRFNESIKKIDKNYDTNSFNTSFYYHLTTEQQKEIGIKGVDEFIKLMPFVLTFISKIESVEIIDKLNSSKTIFSRSNCIDAGYLNKVIKRVNDIEEIILILHAENNYTAIATEVEKRGSLFAIKKPENIPKLFCDFPLIGTEDFHFPFVVNSFYFNPLTERDGVWLNATTDDAEVAENKRILETALDLAKNLITDIEDKSFIELYNLVEIRSPSLNEKYFDENWFKDTILKPFKDFIFHASIVELENESEIKKPIKNLCFPLKSYSESVREKVWHFIYRLYPAYACKKNHLNFWCERIWNDWETVSYRDLADVLIKEKSIQNLAATYCINEDEAFCLINDLCGFILEDEANLSIFEQNELTPNQNGFFKKRSEVYIDDIDDADLINISSLLGDDWGEILLHKNVKFGSYHEKTKKDIAENITVIIERRDKSENYNQAISTLSEWFDNNTELGKEIFPVLYSKRAELFMNTIEDKESLYKVMRSRLDLQQLSVYAQELANNPELLQRASDVDDVLNEFNISNVAELKDILLKAQNGFELQERTSISEQTLLSLGITSAEELEEALKDKHISQQFIHTSTPTIEMFLYAQALISRAKHNVINHLKSLPEYDCSELEELAPTVVAVKKNGRHIYVAIRPSDNGQVIIFYGSEKDVLDTADAELWIDNGKGKPRHLTLGKILKKTGINKIPV